MWERIYDPKIKGLYRLDIRNDSIALCTTRMPNVYKVTIAGDSVPLRIVGISASSLDKAKRRAIKIYAQSTYMPKERNDTM